MGRRGAKSRRRAARMLHRLRSRARRRFLRESVRGGSVWSSERRFLKQDDRLLKINVGAAMSVAPVCLYLMCLATSRRNVAWSCGSPPDDAGLCWHAEGSGMPSANWHYAHGSERRLRRMQPRADEGKTGRATVEGGGEEGGAVKCQASQNRTPNPNIIL